MTGKRSTSTSTSTSTSSKRGCSATRTATAGSIAGVDHNTYHCLIVLVLFETPSGFAMFGMSGDRLIQPNALQEIWANFGVDYRVSKEFREIKDKSSAINHDTGVSCDLAEMIMKWHHPGQKMAVGKPEYKEIIERSLSVPCMFDEIVMEVMWGLKNLMHVLVPQEKMKLSKDDYLPMSQGLYMLLNRYGLDVKPEMVTDSIIKLACFLLDCEYCDVKNSKHLRWTGEYIEKRSGIKCLDWDLMKLATGIKIICYPTERSTAEEAMFTQDELSKLVKDAHKYEGKIRKRSFMNAYSEMVEARQLIPMAQKQLEDLVKEAKDACEAEQST
ncbi:hypothetical protein DAI22_12g103200 [Oryza sativa Japonica Group]|uniref:MAR-binding protein, putative, expressed n=1 Tax=Oryza sativa subsp. japonica TaxID=39947 RepID=Q2QT95_ORYSJ|nr:MAR-binding protein, putative, expressed [Oryza sativa Japonica Group]KAF2907512.1 hypothetical protein DAI22_12g103200 [Oryza sativa Japonica Group]